MTNQGLIRTARDLEQKIGRADAVGCLAMQPELTRVLERLKADGQQVPPGLRDLNNVLCDEAIENWFDNMPV